MCESITEAGQVIVYLFIVAVFFIGLFWGLSKVIK